MRDRIFRPTKFGSVVPGGGGGAGGAGGGGGGGRRGGGANALADVFFRPTNFG